MTAEEEAILAAKKRAQEVPFDENRADELWEAMENDPDLDGDIRVGKMKLPGPQ